MINFRTSIRILGIDMKWKLKPSLLAYFSSDWNYNPYKRNSNYWGPSKSERAINHSIKTL
jgi:hypothetical protein